MSKTIDEKVVEMKFDNKNFEANVQTSLSTLDKLKQKLNLTGASKGLENVQKSAEKLSFNNIENSLAALERRFSTTGIVGMTVIQNLTTSAMNFAKQIKNFSIGSIFDGGKSRATKIENARFQIKGLLGDAQDAAQQLDDIMKDVDYGVSGTAYGLDAAASVAAQLAASGMKAGEGMRYALRGISGVAAMTNSTYEDIGRIYTTVAGNGRLMGDQLLQLSSRGMNAAATLAKALGKTEAEIRDMVSKGKIDFATFAKAMDDAFGEHAKDANKTVNGVVSNIKAAFAKIGADFYSPLIAENGPLVKFLNQVREAINDLRAMLSPVTKEFTDFLNNVLTKITKNPFEKMKTHIQSAINKINDTLKPIKETTEGIKAATKSMQDYGKVVDDIIMGKYKNAPERFQLLAAAGYDWAHAQNLVNERLGCSFRYATNYTESQESVANAQTEVNQSTEELIESLSKLSKEQLKQKGYTDEEADALIYLGQIARKTGIPIKELLELIEKDRFSATYLVLNSFKNILGTLVSLLKSVGNAFGEVFSIKTDSLLDGLAAFHKFTLLLKNKTEKNAKGLTNTLKGLFSILHLITTIVGGGLKFGLKILNAILGAFNISILDLTGGIGELVFKFEQWLTKDSGLVVMLQRFVDWVGRATVAVKNWVIQNEKIMAIGRKIGAVFNSIKDSIKNWTQGLRETDNIPRYIIEGLINGIRNLGPKVIEAFVALGQGILAAIKGVLGIHSPSVEFFEIGKNIIQGLINGIASGLSGLWSILSGIGSKAIEIFKSIDWGKLMAVGVAVGMFVLTKKVTDTIKNFVNTVGAPLKGLGNLLTSVGDAAEEWAKAKKIEAMSNLVKSVAISMLALAGSLLILSRLSWAEIGKSLTAMLGVMTLFGLLVFALSKMDLSGVTGKKGGFLKVSAMLISLSLSMLLMAQSLKSIGKMDPWDIIKAIGALGAMIGGLIVLCKSITKLSGNRGLKDVDKLGKMIRKMATSLLLIVLVMKIAGMLKGKDFLNGIGVMTLFGVFCASMIAVSKFGGSNADKAGKMIRKMATSLLLIVLVIKLCGILKQEDIQKGIQVMKAVGILFAAIIAVSKFAGQNAAKAGWLLMSMASSLMIMVAVIKLIGLLKPEEIKKGIVAIGFLSLFFMGLIAASNLAGANAIKAGSMLLMVASAMLILVGVMYIIGKINPDELKKSLKVVSILSALFAGLMIASHFCTEGCVQAITRMTFAIALLVASVAVLSLINEQRLMGAAKALSAVMVAFGVMLASTKFANGSIKFFKQLLPMTLIVGLLALIVSQLARLPDPTSAVKAAESLAILLLAMSGALVILNKIKSVNKDTAKAILALAGMAAPLALFMLVLNGMKDVNNAIQNVAALSLLAGAMTLLLIPINALGQVMMNGGFQAIGAVALGIAALSAMALPLWAFMAILNGMKDTTNAIQNVNALTKLCGVLTLLLIPLTVLGAIMIATSGIGAGAVVLGILALTAMAIPMIAFINTLKQMNGIEDAIGKMTVLTDFMTKMTDILMKISLVAPLAIMADVAIAGLIGMMIAIGTLAIAVGALMQKFPDLQSFLDTGIPVLIQICDGIGQMVGALIKGALTQIASGLPDIGTNLSLFMTNLTPFIEGMKSIDGKVLAGVATLAGAIIALTAGELVNGILSIFGLDLANLGSRLTQFAENAKGFFEITKSIDPNSIQGIKSLAEAILIITANEILQGMTSWLTGGNSLEKFAEQLPILGGGLRSFIDSLGNITPDQVSIAQNAAEIIKTLATASKEIPNTGGLLGALVGENDMGPWAQQLTTMAEGIVGFVQTIQNGGIENKAVQVANTAAEVIKILANAAKEIPNAGGLLAGLVGDNEMDKFASQFPQVGKGIVGFVQAMMDGEITKDKVEVAKTAAEMIGILAKVAKEIPNTGGLLAALVGDNDLGKFAEKLPDVGKGLNNFAKELTNFKQDKVESIQTAVSAIYALSALSSLNLKDVGNNYGDFGKKLVEFGKKLREFVDEITKTSLDDLTSAEEKINEVLNIVFRLDEVNIEGMKSFSEALKNLAKEGVNGFVNEFSGQDPKTKAKEAIQSMINAGLDGAEEKKSNVFEKFKEVAGEAVKGLENSASKNKAYNAGKDFVQGFANGIKQNMSPAISAGSNLGKQALEAARKAIDSHSPSRETYKLGAFFDQGFVNGIKALSSRVYSASSNVGEEAKMGLTKAISRISNLIENGIDSQPTIRPVLDLTDVENGVNGIGSMFNNPSLAVASNLGAISYGMNANRQNGNEDVVSAIDKLGKSLSGMKGNTYNVNGVTYDDGSNISAAVSELVRAARIERRV